MMDERSFDLRLFGIQEHSCINKRKSYIRSGVAIYKKVCVLGVLLACAFVFFELDLFVWVCFFHGFTEYHPRVSNCSTSELRAGLEPAKSEPQLKRLVSELSFRITRVGYSLCARQWLYAHYTNQYGIWMDNLFTGSPLLIAYRHIIATNPCSLNCQSDILFTLANLISYPLQCITFLFL